MGMIRTFGAVTAISTAIRPVVMAAAGFAGTGHKFAVTAYAFAAGIGTLTVTSMPTDGAGFQPGPNALQGSPTRQGGQQVVLWGFGTATWLNGKTVTVIANNPALNQFSFYFSGQDGNSGTLTTAYAAPRSLNPGLNGVRAVRIECGQGLSTDLLYVGDLNLSSTQYMACLSLAGQLVVEIVGENIPSDEIFILSSASNAGDTAQIVCIY